MYNATLNTIDIRFTLSRSLCSNMTKATISYTPHREVIDLAGISYDKNVATLVCNGVDLFETSVANYYYLVNSLRDYSNPIVLEPDCAEMQVMVAALVCVGNQTECLRGPCYTAAVTEHSININNIETGFCTISQTQEFNYIFYNSFQLYNSPDINISLYNLDENRITSSYNSKLGWGVITDVLGFGFDGIASFELLIYVTENGNIFGNIPTSYGSVDVVVTMASPYVTNTQIYYASSDMITLIREGPAIATF